MGITIIVAAQYAHARVCAEHHKLKPHEWSYASDVFSIKGMRPDKVNLLVYETWLDAMHSRDIVNYLLHDYLWKEITLEQLQ